MKTIRRYGKHRAARFVILLSTCLQAACATLNEEPISIPTLDNAGAYEREGWKLLDDGAAKESAVCFDRALAMDTRSPGARFGGAVARLVTGDPQGAKAGLQATVNMHPRTPHATAAAEFLDRLADPLVIAIRPTQPEAADAADRLSTMLAATGLYDITPPPKAPASTDVRQMCRQATSSGARVLIAVDSPQTDTVRGVRSGAIAGIFRVVMDIPRYEGRSAVEVRVYRVRNSALEATVVATAQSDGALVERDAAAVALDGALAKVGVRLNYELNVSWRERGGVRAP